MWHPYLRAAASVNILKRLSARLWDFVAVLYVWRGFIRTCWGKPENTFRWDQWNSRSMYWSHAIPEWWKLPRKSQKSKGLFRIPKNEGEKQQHILDARPANRHFSGLNTLSHLTSGLLRSAKILKNRYLYESNTSTTVTTGYIYLHTFQRSLSHRWSILWKTWTRACCVWWTFLYHGRTRWQSYRKYTEIHCSPKRQ